MKIFETLMIAVKTWRQGITKCLDFGFDGTSTMVGKNNGVVTLLKNVIPFITSTHYIAHETNLATLEASKNPSCKELFVEIDYLNNHLAFLLEISCEKKCVLQSLQFFLIMLRKLLKDIIKLDGCLGEIQSQFYILFRVGVSVFS